MAADSLGASRLGEAAYAVATRTAVRSVLVDDSHTVGARHLLWEHSCPVTDRLNELARP